MTEDMNFQKEFPSDEEVIQQDMDSLYIGNLNTVEFDLILPRNGKYGSKITWKSGHDVFLTDDGKVKRPAYGTGNRELFLYADFQYGKASGRKVYKVRILEEENKLRVSRVYPVKMRAEAGRIMYLPQTAVVDTQDGDTIPHPVVWNQEGLVLLEKPGIYTFEGRLAGTEIPVTGEVVAKEYLPEEKKNTEPVVRECSEAQIRLLEDSDFYEAQERMREYLLSIDDDQMLYNFRKACGLNTRGAAPMDGWDSEECQLRGHTTGHYMSALALCYHAAGDERIKEKAVYMVEGMKECQMAFERIEGIHAGFLSAYSEEQFDLLEEYTPYPAIWAPYYTLHKIFAGLLDCYKYIESEDALHIAEKLGMWVWKRLSRLSHDKLAKMWSMYIAGEFGGMNAVMAELYGLTGKKEFLQCAKIFDNDKLFYPLEQKTDALSTMHANQHIPQILGAMEIFKATGEKKYFDISEFFWNTVTSAHCYATGGTGEGEMFHEREKIGALLTKNTEETCASYNMLKLTKELFQYNPDVKYMDYYERAVTNHILATQEKRPTGESTYFLPLGPGMKKEFLRENSCCHGTGMESHFKYREGIYFYDENSIYLNLFIPSELRWKEKDILVRQETDCNNPERIKVFVKGSGLNTIKIRKPDWLGNYQIKEAGKELKVTADENGYFQIVGDFAEGKVLELDFPYRFRILRAPDEQEKAALQFGPYIMAAISEEQEFITVPFDESNVENRLVQKENLEFVCEGRRWIPFCKVGEEVYHVYFICESR